MPLPIAQPLKPNLVGLLSQFIQKGQFSDASTLLSQQDQAQLELEIAKNPDDWSRLLNQVSRQQAFENQDDQTQLFKQFLDLNVSIESYLPVFSEADPFNRKVQWLLNLTPIGFLLFLGSFLYDLIFVGAKSALDWASEQGRSDLVTSLLAKMDQASKSHQTLILNSFEDLLANQSLEEGQINTLKTFLTQTQNVLLTEILMQELVAYLTAASVSQDAQQVAFASRLTAIVQEAKSELETLMKTDANNSSLCKKVDILGNSVIFWKPERCIIEGKLELHPSDGQDWLEMQELNLENQG